MQDKPGSGSHTIARRHSSKESRKAHVNGWKKSGLTMSEYCRQNNLAVANLSDWKRSVLQESSQFKPIVSPSSQNILPHPPNLIEVIVNQSIKIRFQCVSDASLIVSVVKELMICS